MNTIDTRKPSMATPPISLSTEDEVCHICSEKIGDTESRCRVQVQNGTDFLPAHASCFDKIRSKQIIEGSKRKGFIG